MNKTLLITLCLVCCGTATAQEPQPMTADDCMAYAVAHNRDVRKAALTLDNYRANRLGAVGDFLPAVSASASAQYNFGRGIDPETNTYTNVTTFYQGFGTSASLPVFDGLARLHALRAARADVLMGKSALESQQDQVALQTLQAFVDVQYYQGTVAMAEEKLRESEGLLRQTRTMEEVGRKSPADVAQMEAQQAQASVEVVRQRNRLEQAMLTLKQVMNWSSNDSLILAPIAHSTQEAHSAHDGDNGPLGLNGAMEEERQAFFAMESARHALRRTKANLWPSISLSAGWSTTYYKTLDAPASTSWRQQMRNNRGEWVAASVSFPLFGRLSTVTAIRRARNNYRYAQEAYEQKREELEKLRREAVMDAEAYRREAEGMQKKVEADSLAYQLTRRQWEEGLSTAIDVTNTSATLLNSRASALQARLMAILKERLARYYGQKD
ncbi:MAG: TolC family protein [Bacteroidaceae bacterium]|nr:TolC family protein [Bacteroidaceae bacterium]